MIWRDYSLNNSLREIVKRYMEMSLENIKLRKENKTLKKELRYYKKHRKDRRERKREKEMLK
jgi:cell shape-determining protein MreC